jgi:kumamolisin
VPRQHELTSFWRICFDRPLNVQEHVFSDLFNAVSDVEAFLWLHYGIELALYPQVEAQIIFQSDRSRLLRALEVVIKAGVGRFFPPALYTFLGEAFRSEAIFDIRHAGRLASDPVNTIVFDMLFHEIARTCSNPLFSAFSDLITFGTDDEWRMLIKQNADPDQVLSGTGKKVDILSAGYFAALDHMGAMDELVRYCADELMGDGAASSSDQAILMLRERIRSIHSWRVKLDDPIIRRRFISVTDKLRKQLDSDRELTSVGFESDSLLTVIASLGANWLGDDSFSCAAPNRDQFLAAPKRASRKFVVLAGSERQLVRGARLIHASHPDQTIEVSVRLRHKSETKHRELKAALEKPGFQPMSRTEYESAHGADPADLNQIRKFAQEFGLKVHETGTELARRTVLVSGTVAQFQKAFNVELKEYSHPKGNFRGRVGAIHVPAEYADIITGVFGLDNRPQAEPHFRRLPETPGIKAHAATISYDPNQVAQIYDYPAGDGTGQCIGLIELGGGFQLNHLTNYFGSLNLATPQVLSVLVDGGTNSPGDPNGPDGEVMLDIEVTGAIAPAAKIVVYFAPNTDQGFLDAITTAVHDSTNQPSVISISWGGPESSWTTQSLTNYDDAFQSAAAMGVTVCVASGDNGSTDGVNDGNNHVDFPASSSFALACGGTTLQANGHIANELVWNDLPNGGAAGGGVSDFFPLPAYQDGFDVPAPTVQGGGRGVPDVSGDADPNTGYNILVDGENAVIGGTSAVAPLWAGLVARINQSTGKPIGYLNPQIYNQASEASGFHDITQGNNGAFSAGPGWDPCTGLGSPDGAKLLAALTGTSSSIHAAASVKSHQPKDKNKAKESAA